MKSLVVLRALYRLQQLGVAGWIGLILLSGAVLVYASRPVLEREALTTAAQIERARGQLDAARARASVPRTPTDAQTMLAGLPGADTLPAFIETMQDEAVRRGLQIDRAEYRQSGTAALRVQVLLPVRGEYPALRRWLETLLYRHPSLALDELGLRRVADGGSTVEARVSLSFYARSMR
jgi:hypothetical protein